MYRAAINRQTLHQLVDRISEQDFTAALRFLEYLAIPAATRAALVASPDDEAITGADVAAIRRAEGDVRAGRVSSHEDLLHELADEVHLA